MYENKKLNAGIAVASVIAVARRRPKGSHGSSDPRRLMGLLQRTSAQQGGSVFVLSATAREHIIPTPMGNQVVAISYLLARTEEPGWAVRPSIEEGWSLGEELSSEVEVRQVITRPVIGMGRGQAFRKWAAN
jgi:hypothetical protein